MATSSNYFLSRSLRNLITIGLTIVVSLIPNLRGEESALEISPSSRSFSQSLEVSVIFGEVAQTGKIFYTTDGSVPTLNSPLYTNPVLLKNGGVFKARGFLNTKPLTPIKSRIYFRIDPPLDRLRSNLSFVILDNQGSGEPNGKLRQPILFGMTTPSKDRTISGPFDFSSFAEVERRGTSSYAWPKFGLKLEIFDDVGQESEVTLGELPLNSDWVLSGRLVFDRSLIRNDLIYRLSRELGYYAPRTRFVELFFKPDTGKRLDYRRHYQGVFSLTEKIKRGRNRVDVPRHSESQAGGYIFKKDQMDPGDEGFEINGFGQLAWVYPKEGKITNEQSEEARAVLQTFVEKLRGEKPDDGSFMEMIDLNSWLTYHWLNLLGKNSDGLVASNYFSIKPTSSGWKIAAGPVWDFDRSMGSLDGKDESFEGWNGKDPSSRYWDDPRAPIWGMLLKDPDFRQAHIDFWQERRQGALSWSNIDKIITEYTTELNHQYFDQESGKSLASPARRNFTRWSAFPPRGGSHLAEIELLRTWLRGRLKWIDQQFTSAPNFSKPTGEIEVSEVIEIIHQGDEIYYTLDGSDPRLPGGAVAPNARSGSAISLSDSAVVTARSRKGTGLTSWSSPLRGVFVVGRPEK